MRKQVLLQVIQGTADANIRFEDLRSLLAALGFSERIKGSYHIFTKSEVAEILNLQARDSFAKPYQVKQCRGNYRRRPEIILYWSGEDQAFIAEVPELPGCAADGSTRQEALANAEIAIVQWLETAQELGRSIPVLKGRLPYA